MSTIQNLQQAAVTLNSIGDNHVKMGANNTAVQSTTSFGGRIVNWFRGSNPEQSAQNRGVIDSYKAKVAQAAGDQYAQVFAGKLAAKHESGRPVSGREIANALREVIQLKTQEDKVKIENAKISVRDEVNHHFNDNSEVLQSIIQEKTYNFTYPPDRIVADGLMDKANVLALEAGEKFAQTNLRQPNADEMKGILNEACRRVFLGGAHDNIATQVTTVMNRGGGENSIEGRMEAMLTEKGIDVEIPASLLNKMEKALTAKIKNATMMEDPSRFVEEPEARAVMDKLVTDYVDSLNMIQTSNLNEESKAVLIKNIIANEALFTPPMIQTSLELMAPAANMIGGFLDKDTQLANAEGGLRDFTNTFTDAVRGPNGQLKKGIEGAHELAAMRIVVTETALETLGVIPPAGAPMTTEEVKSAFSAHRRELVRDPGNFVALKYKLEHMESRQPAEHQKQATDLAMINVITSILAEVEENIYDDKTGVFNVLATNDTAPGMLSYDKLKLIHGDTPIRNEIPSDPQVKQDLVARMQAEADTVFNPLTHTKAVNAGNIERLMGLIETLDAKPNKTDAEVTHLEQVKKELQQEFQLDDIQKNLSETFIKDFGRSLKVTVNGEHMQNSNTNFTKEQQIEDYSKLVSKFPSQEIAGKVLNEFHQGAIASIQSVLMQQPEISEQFMSILMAPEIVYNQGIEVNINAKDDGTYAVELTHSFQKGGQTAFVCKLDFTLSDLDSPKVKYTVNDMDVIIQTHR